jgi:hypothetical protein
MNTFTTYVCPAAELTPHSAARMMSRRGKRRCTVTNWINWTNGTNGIHGIHGIHGIKMSSAGLHLAFMPSFNVSSQLSV